MPVDEVTYALKRSGGSADVGTLAAQTGVSQTELAERLAALEEEGQVVADGPLWRLAVPA